MLVLGIGLWMAYDAVPLRSDEWRLIEGAPTAGWKPVLIISRVQSEYYGSVNLEYAGADELSSTWLRLTPSATCRLEPIGIAAHIEDNRSLSEELVRNLPERVSVESYLEKFHRRLWSHMWIRCDASALTFIQPFSMRITSSDPETNHGVLLVELILYRVANGGRTAALVKFKPLEVQLPPFEASPSPTAPTLAPASSPYPVDPNWANPDRVAALADLPVPSASWLPWAAWGAAAAALVAAGLLYRRRRRAAS